MTFLTLMAVLGVFVAGGIAACICILLDVHRINRTPEDDYPISRHRRDE